MSALTRQWREGAFGDAEFRRVHTRMREDFDAYRIEPLSRTVEDLAVAAMALSPLRAMEALHIGSAQAAGGPASPATPASVRIAPRRATPAVTG